VTQATPAARLRSHVDRILDRSAIQECDRQDLIEELYGHLWQSWQDGIAAGLSSEAAADVAISGFGDPGLLSRDMTLAYHSRLYASTIGVLLPAVTPSSDKPNGYGRARVMLFLAGLFAGLYVAVAPFANPPTPLRLVVQELVLLLVFVMTVLAYRALARSQRWALVYTQFLTLAYVAYAVLQLFAQPISISITGILVAIFVLPATFDPRLARWVADSRRTGKVLGAVIVASVVLGMAAPQMVASMPDPTQASPTDLSIGVRVDCTRTAGLVTGGKVTATIRWAKTDFLPYGFRPNMSQTDILGLSSTSSLDFDPGPNGPQFPRGLEGGVYVAGNWVMLDSETGEAGDAGVLMWSGPGFFDVGEVRDGIDPGSIQANRDYVASLGFGSVWPAGLPDDPVFRIRYDHQGRWGVQAFATCGQAGVGQPVTTPDSPTWSEP
jgi:hypothetical protein